MLDFYRVRREKLQKCAYWIHHVCPSVSPHLINWEPLNGFSQNLILVASIKVFYTIKFYLEADRNNGKFTRRASSCILGVTRFINIREKTFWTQLIREYKHKFYLQQALNFFLQSLAGFKILKQQEALGRTNRLLSLIRHGPRLKRRVQQVFYCCVCIRYHGNISTEPLPSNDGRIFTEALPSNDKGIFTEPSPSNDRRIFTEPLPSNDKGTFTEPLPSNDKRIFTEPLPSNDMGTFTKPLPSNDRGIHRHTHTVTWAHKPTYIFSK
jgi:hypothetical protein